MKLLLLIAFLFTGAAGYSQTAALPQWFTESFLKKGLDSKYTIQPYLSPGVLHGDFNGDAVEDVAVLVVDKAKGKKGILLMHGNTHDHFLFGSGKSLGKGASSFKSADRWGLYTESSAFQSRFDPENGHLMDAREVQLSSPAIFIHDDKVRSASEGWLIHWNGKKYTWMHQGG